VITITSLLSSPTFAAGVVVGAVVVVVGQTFIMFQQQRNK
jgi:hypothetical protein